MKRMITDCFQRLRQLLRLRRLWVMVLVLSLCILPSTARAGGLGNILSLLKTITSTIQGTIGSALNEIQNLNTELNTFRQQIIWPINAINQAKSFVNLTRTRYGHSMFSIVNIRNNSANLVPPSQLESLVRSGQSGYLNQLQPAYTNIYGAVPAPANANPLQRNMTDLDDALAMGSLKTTMLSDQTTASVLGLADSIEQQSSAAAPGSGPLLAAQAQVAELETQALIARILAAELRTEAAKLANQNAWFKQSSSSVRSLQHQLQQVLSQP